MNMPDINKKAVNLLLPLETVAKVNKLAKTLDISTGALISLVLANELNKRVRLEPDDYMWIAKEVKKNVDRRAQRKVAKK